MTKLVKVVGGFLLLGGAALQFTNPSHRNPPIVPGHDLLASNAPPAAMAALLRNACYNCHSFETDWPWYSYVAPVSWLMGRDVSAARAALNFSEWPHDDSARARKRWRHIAEAVQNGEMPMPSYARIHREARLDDPQRAALVKWAQSQSEQ
jgi:Haem-binding domain